jgi:hypothetical protein
VIKAAELLLMVVAALAVLQHLLLVQVDMVLMELLIEVAEVVAVLVAQPLITLMEE